ncbi:methyltransferase [Sandaracinobacteroides saxicola]|uniref:Methyltransferase n=1 Tax=Sandaracinobacteroides saxicola TaxID=2759707 RepID=A0A7G5IKS6_9SPHN|nr:methyltransferase [Sandaracinobacteroides saxicola]QMW23968.1 methyltransferase [Sandaracinobacteroides saxicola]
MAWDERWAGWRNGMLGSARFQALAARTPGLRGMARRHGAALFDLVAGFVYAQVLAACVELGLFERLAGGARDGAGLASDMGLSDAATERLLKAAAALALVQRLRDGRWMLGVRGAALRGNPGIAAMVAHHRALYADLNEPVALLRRERGGALAGYWDYDRAAADNVAAYSTLMAASQPMVARQVLDAVSLADARCLLDVGGGEGAFLEAVRARWPRLALHLFDLPPVVARAQARLGPGVTVHGGSFHDDPLPVVADVITLVRVLHDHDDAEALLLLRRVHAALPAGGRLVIAEPMADTAGARAMGDAYFGLYLWAMGRGRPRTGAEIIAMLRAVGFAGARMRRTGLPLVAGMIVAHR